MVVVVVAVVVVVVVVVVTVVVVIPLYTVGASINATEIFLYILVNLILYTYD